MAQIIRNSRLPFLEFKQRTASFYPVKKHSHEEVSVGLVESGSSRVSCQGLDVDLFKNQAVLIPPGVIHLCQPSDESRFAFLMIYIEKNWFKSVCGLFPGDLSPRAVGLGQKEILQVYGVLDRFKALKDRLALESEAAEFVGTLFFDILSVPQRLQPAAPSHGKSVKNVKSFMDTHFTEEVPLDTLAGLCGKTKFSLIRQFKSRYQLTPHAYLLNKRIHLARQLLQKGSTCAETAAACGFFDQSHFIKVFRTYVGMNPADYKNAGL